MSTSTSIICFALAGLLLAGCSDDEKKACPAGGLGVTAPSGKKCNEILDPTDPDLAECQSQIENYSDYNCKTPQVCFDTNFQPGWGFIISPSAAAYRMAFILTNCSTGGDKLVIQSVEVLGNSRCYFDFDMDLDVEKLELGPGESGLIAARYFPKQAGEDDAILRVHTNAENFPQLDLYVCGSGIPKYAPGADSGAPPDMGVGDGGTGRFCKNVTTPESCP